LVALLVGVFVIPVLEKNPVSLKPMVSGYSRPA